MSTGRYGIISEANLTVSAIYETSALIVVFGILEGERLKWRGIKMSQDHLTYIQEAAKSLDQRPIAVTSLERVLAA